MVSFRSSSEDGLRKKKKIFRTGGGENGDEETASVVDFFPISYPRHFFPENTAKHKHSSLRHLLAPTKFH